MNKIIIALLICFAFFSSEKAEGQINYTDLVPDSVLVPSSSFGGSIPYDFDVNGDDIMDFSFNYGLNYGFPRVKLISKGDNQILCYLDYPDTLIYGEMISTTSLSWASFDPEMVNYNSSYGIWYYSINKCIGFRIEVGSDYYYGWFRLKNYCTINDYAYNTVPNEEIIAGQGIPPVAEEVTVEDVTNFNDGRDLRISFKRAINENLITGYRAIVVKSSDADSFNIDLANIVASENYTEVIKTGYDISITLTSVSTDADGEAISEMVPYKVFVLSVADGINYFENILSDESPEITLTSPCPLASNVHLNAIYAGGNLYNINMSFNKPIDESGIVEYRAFFIKCSDSLYFDSDTALSAAPPKYISFIPDGSNVAITINSDTLHDFYGNIIEHRTKYCLSILGIANGVSTNVSTLSPFSNVMNLETKIGAVTEVLATDDGDLSNETDFRISFNGLPDETGLEEYRVAVVKLDSSIGATYENVRSLPADRYYKIDPPVINTVDSLPEGLLDSDGDAVTSENIYRLIVYTIPDSVLADVGSVSFTNSLLLNTPDYLQAGLTNENVLYTDVYPDESFFTYHLSIDGDYIEDFTIETIDVYAGGGESHSLKITPLNGNEIAIKDGSADTLNFGDMVYEGMEWTGAPCTLHYNFYAHYGGGGSGGNWFNMSDKYLGLKIKSSSETLYGWAKIDCSLANNYPIIEEYACEISDNGVDELIESKFSLYPNPVSSTLNIQFYDFSPNQKDLISIRDITGKEHMSKLVTNEKMIIEFQDITAGIYFIEWKHKDRVFRKKFVVCR